jgi:hypothetical protein
MDTWSLAALGVTGGSFGNFPVGVQSCASTCQQ